jgi:hypothetical protein
MMVVERLFVWRIESRITISNFRDARRLFGSFEGNQKSPKKLGRRAFDRAAMMM